MCPTVQYVQLVWMTIDVANRYGPHLLLQIFLACHRERVRYSSAEQIWFAWNYDSACYALHVCGCSKERKIIGKIGYWVHSSRATNIKQKRTSRQAILSKPFSPTIAKTTIIPDVVNNVTIHSPNTLFTHSRSFVEWPFKKIFHTRWHIHVCTILWKLLLAVVSFAKLCLCFKLLVLITMALRRSIFHPIAHLSTSTSAFVALLLFSISTIIWSHTRTQWRCEWKWKWKWSINTCNSIYYINSRL